MFPKSLIASIASHLQLEPKSIRLAKFMHGERASARSKVLFYVTANDKEIGILKVLRGSEHNDKLRREEKGQTRGASLQTFKTARVIFHETVGAHYVYLEEVVQGSPVGKQNAPSLLPLVYAYQTELPKGEPMDLSRILALLPSWQDAPRGYLDLIERLKHMGGELYAGFAHGDMTHMNIMVSPSGYFLIDWERSGERPIWGLDFVHYAARCANAKDAVQFSDYLEQHASYADRAYMGRAYILDVVFDYLQKGLPEQYERFTSGLQAISGRTV